MVRSVRSGVSRCQHGPVAAGAGGVLLLNGETAGVAQPPVPALLRESRPSESPPWGTFTELGGGRSVMAAAWPLPAPMLRWPSKSATSLMGRFCLTSYVAKLWRAIFASVPKDP
jgi:hypothetical protein